LHSFKVASTKENRWVPKHNIEMSPDGLKAKAALTLGVVAEKGFPIYWKNTAPYFLGRTILYYYEIAQLSSK
jgi:hypothetical protein